MLPAIPVEACLCSSLLFPLESTVEDRVKFGLTPFCTPLLPPAFPPGEAGIRLETLLSAQVLLGWSLCCCCCCCCWFVKWDQQPELIPSTPAEITAPSHPLSGSLFTLVNKQFIRCVCVGTNVCVCTHVL